MLQIKESLLKHHRARTARNLWLELRRQTGAANPRREVIRKAYFELSDFMHVIPPRARLSLGGTIERGV